MGVQKVDMIGLDGASDGVAGDFVRESEEGLAYFGSVGLAEFQKGFTEWSP